MSTELMAPPDRRELFRQWMAEPDTADLPNLLSEADWRSWGGHLRRAGEALALKIARWAIYGEEKFGYSARQTSELLGVAVHQVRCSIWVGRTAFQLKRAYPEFQTVSVTAFQIVAPEYIAWSEKVLLLRHYRQQRMTVAAFRKYVYARDPRRREIEPAVRQAGTAGTLLIPLRFHLETWERLKSLAQAAGCSPEEYIARRVQDAWGGEERVA